MDSYKKDIREYKKYILIILLLIVGGLLFNYYQFKKGEDNLVNPGQEVKESEEQSIEQVTEGWNIYKNERYGYSVKYPADWNYFEGGRIEDPEVIDITRFFTKKYINTTIKIRVYENPGEGYQNILGGGEGSQNIKAVSKTSSDYYFLISFSGKERGIKTFDQLVDTFEFIGMPEEVE